jgi:hypothetical protein
MRIQVSFAGESGVTSIYSEDARSRNSSKDDLTSQLHDLEVVTIVFYVCNPILRDCSRVMRQIPSAIPDAYGDNIRSNSE